MDGLLSDPPHPVQRLLEANPDALSTRYLVASLYPCLLVASTSVVQADDREKQTDDLYQLDTLFLLRLYLQVFGRNAITV